MDTSMPPPSLADSQGELAEFRVTSKVEVAATLQRLCDANLPLNLNGPDGSACSVLLWTVDRLRDSISFSADIDDPRLQAVLQCDEAVAVAFMDKIKLQFDVHDMVLVHRGSSCALKCDMPREIYRFQRRESFRVRPLLRNTPVAKLRHPMIPDMRLDLRILDVSIGGCALLLPDDLPPLSPGVVLNGVMLELDVQTCVKVSLHLQHISAINPQAKGVRLGCELIEPSRDLLRSLQAYIDQTQRRRRLMALT